MKKHSSPTGCVPAWSWISQFENPWRFYPASKIGMQKRAKASPWGSPLVLADLWRVTGFRNGVGLFSTLRTPKVPFTTTKPKLPWFSARGEPTPESCLQAEKVVGAWGRKTAEITVHTSTSKVISGTQFCEANIRCATREAQRFRPDASRVGCKPRNGPAQRVPALSRGTILICIRASEWDVLSRLSPWARQSSAR